MEERHIIHNCSVRGDNTKRNIKNSIVDMSTCVKAGELIVKFFIALASSRSLSWCDFVGLRMMQTEHKLNSKILLKDLAGTETG